MKSVSRAAKARVLHSPSISAAAPFQDVELKPGTPDALQKGCTCDPFHNRFGAGHHEDGKAVYFPNQDCPLHGVEAVEEAMEFSSDVRMVREWPSNE